MIPNAINAMLSSKTQYFTGRNKANTVTAPSSTMIRPSFLSGHFFFGFRFGGGHFRQLYLFITIPPALSYEKTIGIVHKRLNVVQ